MKAHISDYENKIQEEFKKVLQDTFDKGMLQGCVGILGAVKNMCDEGKTVEDIKTFCEKYLKDNKLRAEGRND